MTVHNGCDARIEISEIGSSEVFAISESNSWSLSYDKESSSFRPLGHYRDIRGVKGSEWSMSIGGYLDYVDPGQQLLISGTEKHIKLYPSGNAPGQPFWEGDVYLESWSTSGAPDELIQFNISATGVSDLLNEGVSIGDSQEPEFLVCDPVAKSLYFGFGATENITDNTVEVTNSGAPSGVVISTYTDVFVRPNSQIWGAEITLDGMTGGDGTFGIAFGQPTALSGGLVAGVSVKAGVGDAEISYSNTFGGPPTLIASGLTVEVGDTVKLVYNGATGAVTCKINDDVIALGNEPLLANQYCTIFSIGQPAAGAGNTITTTTNPGTSLFSVDYINEAVGYCSLTAINPVPDNYQFVQVIQNGNGTSAGRIAGWTTAPSVFSSWIGYIQEVLPNSKAWNSETYEVETTIYQDNATFDDESVGAVSGTNIITGQSLVALKVDSTESFDSTKVSLSIIYENAAGAAFDTETLLIPELPDAVGIVRSVTMESASEIRLGYKTPSDQVIFDPIPIEVSGSTAPYLIASQGGVTSDTDTLELQYNGHESHMQIDQYPDTFKDSFGNDMPSNYSATGRSVRYLEDWDTTLPGESLVISGGGKIATLTSVSVPANFLTNCSVLYRMDTGIVAGAMEILAHATSNSAVRFECKAMNRNSIFGIYKNGANLVLRSIIAGVAQPEQTIKTAYAAGAGHKLVIVINPTTGVVDAHLLDGSTNSASINFDNHASAVYMPRVGHDDIESLGSVQFGNLLEAADMGVDVEAVVPATASDVLGVEI